MFLHRLSFIFSSVLLLALSGCASLSEPSLETFAWEEELDAVKLSRGWEAAGDWLKQRQAEMIADGASTEDIYALSKEASELFHLLEDLPNAALVEEAAAAAESLEEQSSSLLQKMMFFNTGENYSEKFSSGNYSTETFSNNRKTTFNPNAQSKKSGNSTYKGRFSSNKNTDDWEEF